MSARPELESEGAQGGQLALDRFFEQTDRRIADKIWRTESGMGLDARNLWVPALAERFDTHFRATGSPTRPDGTLITDLNKFLRKHNEQKQPMAITGPAGSGKTIELIKLYADFRPSVGSPEGFVPVLVFLNTLPSGAFRDLPSQGGLKQFLREYVSAAGYSDDVMRAFPRIMDEHRLLVLLDGLDELPDKSEYEAAIKTIGDQFIQEVQRLGWRLLLSARTEDYDARIQMIELAILPLTEDRVEGLLRSGRKRGSFRGPEAIRALRDGELKWFERYKSNPYFLTLLMDALEHGARPRNMQELFRKAIERELSKADPGAFTASNHGDIEACCGVLAYLLLAKTLNHTGAQFDFNDPADVRAFLLCCARAANEMSPFKEIFAEESQSDRGEPPGAGQGPTAFMNLVLEAARAGRDYSPRVVTAMVVSAELFERVVRIGIEKRLIRTDPKAPSVVVGFRHKRLLEYFAALYLEESQYPPEGPVTNLWYKQTLCILTGITSDLRRVLDAIGYDEPQRALLAGEAASFAHANSAAMARETLDGLAKVLLGEIQKGPATRVALSALQVLRDMAVSGVWMPSDAIVEIAIARASDPAAFLLCRDMLARIAADRGLAMRTVARFVVAGLRNIVSSG